jgi:uncharacterized protein (DUF1778 family)
MKASLRKIVNFRLAEEEVEVLDDYARLMGKSRTDIIRSLLQSLKHSPGELLSDEERREALDAATKVFNEAAENLIELYKTTAMYYVVDVATGALVSCGAVGAGQ